LCNEIYSQSVTLVRTIWQTQVRALHSLQYTTSNESTNRQNLIQAYARTTTPSQTKHYTTSRCAGSRITLCQCMRDGWKIRSMQRLLPNPGRNCHMVKNP